MGKLFCLFSISCNTAYTTIQGCKPTNDRVLLENLRSNISEIRPPNRSMTIEIIETNESCSPTDAGWSAIRRIQEHLG